MNQLITKKVNDFTCWCVTRNSNNAVSPGGWVALPVEKALFAGSYLKFVNNICSDKVSKHIVKTCVDYRQTVL